MRMGMGMGIGMGMAMGMWMGDGHGDVWWSGGTTTRHRWAVGKQNVDPRVLLCQIVIGGGVRTRFAFFAEISDRLCQDHPNWPCGVWGLTILAAPDILMLFSRFLTLGAFSSLMEHLVDMWPPHRPGEAGSRAPCRAPCVRRGAPWPRCSCAASCAVRAPWCAVVRGGGWVALASPNATKSRRSRKRVGPGAIRLNFCGMGQNPCPKAVLCPDNDDKLIFTVKDIMQWHCVVRKALPA